MHGAMTADIASRSAARASTAQREDADQDQICSQIVRAYVPGADKADTRTGDDMQIAQGASTSLRNARRLSCHGRGGDRSRTSQPVARGSRGQINGT